jgi:hypothetical protein
VRIEVARLHHADDATHDLGFVDADGMRQAGGNAPGAEDQRSAEDGEQRRAGAYS